MIEMFLSASRDLHEFQLNVAVSDVGISIHHEFIQQPKQQLNEVLPPKKKRQQTMIVP